MSAENPLEIPGASALSEADEASIDILLKERLGKIMNTRPSELTNLELAAAVKYFRAKRATFMSEENRKLAAGPKTAGGAKSSKPVKSIAEAISAHEIDTSDIF